ncbi:hypothetical protein SAMN04244553_2462 [Nocardia amikacinitolerans]|uniref:Uncharacterized protein n=1 Tax=Nocardia amikacinitolerans TaxID=756689 RepID=A0A285L7J3_9NOCA|nr:hypothetical protein SAMN04244553_2462 [Nocardia amikacinitolerans]
MQSACRTNRAATTADRRPVAKCFGRRSMIAAPGDRWRSRRSTRGCLGIRLPCAPLDAHSRRTHGRTRGCLGIRSPCGPLGRPLAADSSLPARRRRGFGDRDQHHPCRVARRLQVEQPERHQARDGRLRGCGQREGGPVAAASTLGASLGCRRPRVAGRFATATLGGRSGESPGRFSGRRSHMASDRLLGSSFEALTWLDIEPPGTRPGKAPFLK